LEAWTDERLDDLAATLRPLPGELAELRAELARLTAAVEHLVEENRAIRADLSALQRQIAQIGWGLSAALVGVLVALIVAVV
jgi:prefoldin subunit 5